VEIILITFIAGLISAFIGSLISGASSMISITALLVLGVPAHLSLSTFRFSNIFWHIGGLFEYAKKKKVVWKYVIPLILITIPTTILGVKLALSIDEEFFAKILKVLILIFIPLTLLNKKLGVEPRVVTKTKVKIGYFFNAVIRVWAGMFPFGAGIFHTYNYVYFFGLTLLQLKGTSRIPGIASNLVGFLTFLYAGVVDWKLALSLGFGMLFGGFIGARYTIRIGDNILRYFLILSIIFLIIKSFL